MNAQTNSARLSVFVTVVAIGLGLLTNSEASAAPQTREAWTAYVANGQRFGSKHVTVSKEPGGNFRYSIASRVLIDLLGAQEQELKTQEEYVVTEDYQPISISYTRSGPTADLVVKGKARDNVLQLQISRGDFVSSRSIELTRNRILDACLDDYLIGNSTKDENRRVEFSILDSNDWYAHAAVAEEQPAADRQHQWSVDLGVLGQGTMTFDHDGRHLTTTLRTPPIDAVRCTAQQASQLQHRKLVGRDVLMFPLSKDIGLPNQLKRLKIRLKWKDVPLSDLQLSDLRQKIAKQAEQAGAHSVDLEITAASPITRSVALPISGSQFQPYLAESLYIKPHDEDISRTAREWAGKEPDTLAAVRTLSREVSKYLQGGTLIAETLSGPEVLHCKQGKCSEFSTLFASLARSIGIPTRIVLGERLAGGQWVGHMWNEAYVGDWITVDTTVDEVGTSFSLIKLTHSDTVLGTQRARFGLTGSLEIEVVDFEKTSTSAPTAKTGITGQTYTNADFSCQITAANKDWTLVDKSQPGAAMIQFQVPDKGVLIHFVAFAVPPNIAPETIGKSRQSLSASQLNDFKMLKNEAFDLGDAKGQVATFQGTSKAKKNKRTKTTEYVWIDGGAGYLLNLIASPANHEKYATEVEATLKTFGRSK